MNTPGTVTLTRVSFSPLADEPTVRYPEIDFGGNGPADRMLRELRQPLADLARRVRRLGPVDEGAVVLVTGTRRDAGTSALALALAGAAAAERPVVLIDAHTANPSLSRQLCPTAKLGWDDVIHGQCSFERPLARMEPHRTFALLPLRQADADLAVLLTESTFKPWVTRLRQEFGLIVVDGGPVESTGSLCASWADVALLACAEDSSPSYERAAAWDSLEEGGTHVLGIVETFASRVE